MLITYLRSSSYGTWDMCPHSYWMNYCLGQRSPANKKAVRGNIVHKALELLARKKLAMQNGQEEFTEDETGRTFKTDLLQPDEALDVGYAHYSSQPVPPTWKAKDQLWTQDDEDLCRQWMWDTIHLHGGLWNPLNRKVIMPEQYFDMTFDEPWAKYDYVLPNGDRATGQFSIKGTVDLLTEAAPRVLEYLDWKTGMRLNWATGEVKTWKKLRNDPQLRMYHYALSKLYPDVDEIIMSIVYIQDGEVEKGVPNRGSFSMPYDRDDLPKTEEMLRKRFKLIQESTRPKLNKSWKCKAFCHYGMNKQPGTDKTICEYFADELRKHGMEAAMKLHADPTAFASYGSGGGRSDGKGL